MYDKAVIHTFKNSNQRPRCAMHWGLSIALNLDVRPTPPTINIVGSLHFVYWFTTEDIQQLSKYVEQFADRSPEEELLDVYFDIPKAPGVETRTVKFLTSSEIQAKLVSYGNLHRPIPLRTLCQMLDNKGYQRMRSSRKRGYLVVELEATEINSSRIASSGTMPF